MNWAVNQSYPHVLFDSGIKDHNLQKLYTQAQYVLEVLTADTNYLYNFLKNNSIDKSKRKEVVTLIFDKKIEKSFLYFIWTIIDFNQSYYLLTIVKKFLNLCHIEFGILYIKVTSAFELSNTQIQHLQEALSNHYHSKVMISNVIDPSIIGGIKIQSAIDTIDGSIASKIKIIKEHLFTNLENNTQ